MSKSSNQDAVALPHALHLSGRKAMEIEGVEQIIAFDEKQILLKTSEGMMQIAGKSLQVKALAPDSGKARIDGQIDSLSYTGRKSHGTKSLFHIFR